MVASHRASSIDIVEAHDLAGRPGLRAAWEALRARAVTRGPFLSWDWTVATARALGPARILLAWRGGALVGALPLVAERRPLARAPARLLRSLSDDHSQRWDAMVDDDDVAAALVAHLLAERGWDALELRDAPAGPRNGVARLVAAARAAGCLVGTWPSQRSPYLTLGVARGRAKFHANVRRRARRLAGELGPVALERASLDALDDGLELEALGWKGRAGTAIACDPALAERYRDLARALAASGTLALDFLRAGGRRVAFHFAAIEDGVYYLFKTGSDPALARHGLGHLLVAEVARDPALRELDFLGGDAPWKREWTDTVRAHDFTYVFRPTIYGRALASWKLGCVPALRWLLG
jgi:CelD/BcsL family acetyltransferase involved in cellulose biosynthesis